MRSSGSNAERDARSGGGREHLAGHLALRLLGEVETAAMHRDQHIRIELADLRHHLAEIVGGAGPR